MLLITVTDSYLQLFSIDTALCTTDKQAGSYGMVPYHPTRIIRLDYSVTSAQRNAKSVNAVLTTPVRRSEVT